ncbi:ArsR/SmtB family transcription factor [Sneathiella chinensis]|uniref:ArsR family transcriptional regulator n=1 Tax=Sneathiella chinensis TaxID=349750 RepID=A0ABQ5U8P5_9PROT|nr:metalloregulator ArsR/SmtB family transcription factor [Sneathiella chinensis]GLQ06836.1 ArsR family transcriptional regulator [Sneathiella chinensis]
MTDTETQITMFTEFADLARTLGNAHRITLLDHIAQGERPVERLAELSGLTVGNASQHLQTLKRAGFVRTRRNGKQILYSLGDGPVLAVLASLRDLAEFNHGQIRALVADSRGPGNDSEGISQAELTLRMQENSVTLLDVRPEEEYRQGHLPGALNIPAEELERRLSELPANLEIIAYCRGPYCVLSVDAVAALRSRGYTARRLKTGFTNWKAAGLHIEQD